MIFDPRKMRTFQKWYYDKEDEQRMEEYAKEIDQTQYSLCPHWIHTDTDCNVVNVILFVKTGVDSPDLGIILGSDFFCNSEPQAIIFRGSRYKLKRKSDSKRAFLAEGLSYKHLCEHLNDSTSELKNLITIDFKGSDGRQRIVMPMTKKNPYYCAR